jgi:hypothetical protein
MSSPRACRRLIRLSKPLSLESTRSASPTGCRCARSIRRHRSDLPSRDQEVEVGSQKSSVNRRPDPSGYPRFESLLMRASSQLFSNRCVLVREEQVLEVMRLSASVLKHKVYSIKCSAQPNGNNRLFLKGFSGGRRTASLPGAYALAPRGRTASLPGRTELSTGRCTVSLPGGTMRTYGQAPRGVAV